MDTTGVLIDLRQALARRRAAARAQRVLERELASLTDAERTDLLATAERYPDEQTVVLRTMLMQIAA